MARRQKGNIDVELLARTRRGEFTKSNTEKGTPERRAVDRHQYLKRRAAHPDLSARQALGHPKPEDVHPTISLMVDDPPRFIVIETDNRRDLKRAARYDNLVSQLASGRLSPAAFRRWVGSWRPIADHHFLSDPDVVLAIIEARRAGEQELFVYSSGRAS
jgi:hypothetical protein